jgi:hypothetical protein
MGTRPELGAWGERGGPWEEECREGGIYEEEKIYVSLLNWSHLSYKNRGFQVGALAGVGCKI